MNGNSNHAAEETLEAPAAPSAPVLTRQQRKAQEALARKAAREAQASAPAPTGEPVPLSPEWFTLQIATNEALVNQAFAQWQQMLGGLNALRQLQAVALAQQAAPPA